MALDSWHKQLVQEESGRHCVAKLGKFTRCSRRAGGKNGDSEEKRDKHAVCVAGWV